MTSKRHREQFQQVEFCILRRPRNTAHWPLIHCEQRAGNNSHICLVTFVGPSNRLVVGVARPEKIRRHGVIRQAETLREKTEEKEKYKQVQEIRSRRNTTKMIRRRKDVSGQTSQRRDRSGTRWEQEEINKHLTISPHSVCVQFLPCPACSYSFRFGCCCCSQPVNIYHKNPPTT